MPKAQGRTRNVVNQTLKRKLNASPEELLDDDLHHESKRTRKHTGSLCCQKVLAPGRQPIPQGMLPESLRNRFPSAIRPAAAAAGLSDQVDTTADIARIF